MLFIIYKIDLPLTDDISLTANACQNTNIREDIVNLDRWHHGIRLVIHTDKNISNE